MPPAAGTAAIMPAHLMRDDLGGGSESLDGLRSDLCLALAHVPAAEQELPVQVARLDGVHVDL